LKKCYRDYRGNRSGETISICPTKALRFQKQVFNCCSWKSETPSRISAGYECESFDITFADFYRLDGAPENSTKISEIGAFRWSGGNCRYSFYDDRKRHLRIADHILNKLLLSANVLMEISKNSPFEVKRVKEEKQ